MPVSAIKLRDILGKMQRVRVESRGAIDSARHIKQVCGQTGGLCKPAEWSCCLSLLESLRGNGSTFQIHKILKIYR